MNVSPSSIWVQDLIILAVVLAVVAAALLGWLWRPWL